MVAMNFFILWQWLDGEPDGGYEGDDAGGCSDGADNDPVGCFF